MATSHPHTLREPLPSVITVAHLVYALHTVAIVVGLVGAATVVGSFVGGLPSIAAVLCNYLKRGDARGTWVYTHYQWQIRTFWWAVLWAILVLPLYLLLFLPGMIAHAIVGLWYLYRCLKGWLRFSNGRLPT